MSSVSLNSVRWLTLREIAAHWAPQANIPEPVMLRELQYAVINIPRLENGEGLFDVPPPDEELPDPDKRVDRQWLQEFCAKQGWTEPEFWFGRKPRRKATVGRPSYMPEILQELRERAERGQLAPTVTEQARQLVEWVEAAFPNTQTPRQGGTENGIREEFKRLKAGASNQ